MVARVVALVAVAGCGRIDFDSSVPAMSGWSDHVNLVIANPTQDVLYDVPVPVTLDPSRIDYTRAAPDGHDLRFTVETDRVLAHEIERWDPAGTSLVWVRIPMVEASPTPTLLAMHYANPDAVALPGEAAWSAEHVAVFHFSDGVRDATATVDAQAVDVMTSEGVLGDALALSPSPSGRRSYAVIEHRPVLDEIVSYSGWIRSVSPTVGLWEALITQGIPDDNFNTRHLGLYEDRIYFETHDNSGAAEQRVLNVVPLGTWVHLAMVVGPTSVATFVDGVARETLPVPNGARRSVQPMFFGADCDSCSLGTVVATSDFLDGALDEIRLERVARNETWFAFQVAAMQDRVIQWAP